MLPSSRHFTAQELACKDGTPYPLEWPYRLKTLLDMLDAIRAAIGVPLEVVSGYRTPAYNTNLAGKSPAHQVASGSYHTQGQAADLRPIGKTVAELHAAIMELYLDEKLPELGGIGFYPVSNWIHVDTHHAPDGHLRRWNGN